MYLSSGPSLLDRLLWWNEYLDLGQADILGRGTDRGDGQSQAGDGFSRKCQRDPRAIIVEGPHRTAASITEGEGSAGDLIIAVGTIIEHDLVHPLRAGPGQIEPTSGPTVNGGPFSGEIVWKAINDAIDGFAGQLARPSIFRGSGSRGLLGQSLIIQFGRGVQNIIDPPSDEDPSIRQQRCRMEFTKVAIVIQHSAGGSPGPSPRIIQLFADLDSLAS